MTRPRPNTRIFLVAGLLVGLAVALVVSPFASSSPDGLERVAEDEGFAEAADEHDLARSPLADYRAEGVGDDRLSTGVAGAVGVLLTFGIGIAAFGALRALRPAEDVEPPPRDDRGPSDRSTA